MNLGLIIPRHARYRPDHTAVIFRDQRLTYAQFNRRVNRAANALRAVGIGKDDKVATLLPNCIELLDIYWACAALGAVVVPLSPLLRGKGLLRLLTDSDTALILTEAAFVPHLEAVRADLGAIAPDRFWLIDGSGDGYHAYADRTAAAPDSAPPAVAIHPDDPYNIIYSSGTTGLPKGIVHTHQIRGNYATLFGAAYRILPESVVLHTGSIIFNGAFLTLMPAFFHGATYILHDHFDPDDLVATVAREGVTHIKMVPSQIVALLHCATYDPAKLASLQMLGSVGAPLHHVHKEQVLRDLPDRFYELYGLTEGFMTILDKTDAPRKLDSVGCPPPFFEMRIVDEAGRDLPVGEVGEIVGRCPVTMPGYYKRPDLTAQVLRDGWLYSGDLGYVDEDGFLYLVDRKKDLIISGGVNVYPRDIEEIILHHEAVAECAVFGVEDEKWGETPVAAVRLKTPDAVGADALLAWINGHIEARFQRVSAVLIRADFPRSTAGKTLKRVLREEYAAQQQSANG